MNGRGAGDTGGPSRYFQYIPIARRPANAGIARTPGVISGVIVQRRTASEPQQQPAVIRRRPNPNASGDEHGAEEIVDKASAGDEEGISSEERTGVDAHPDTNSSDATEDGTAGLDPLPRSDPNEPHSEHFTGSIDDVTERASSDNAIDADENDTANAGDEEEIPTQAAPEPDATSPGSAESADSTEDRTTDLDPLPQPDPNEPFSDYYTDLINDTHVASTAYRDYILEQVQSEPTEGKKKKKFQRLLAETYAFLRA